MMLAARVLDVQYSYLKAASAPLKDALIMIRVTIQPPGSPVGPTLVHRALSRTLPYKRMLIDSGRCRKRNSLLG